MIVPSAVAARPLEPAGPSECTISGTNGGDVLRGTPGRDVICGPNGKDETSAWPQTTASEATTSRNGGPGRDVYVADAGDTPVSVETTPDC